jgi:hypothetical protein
VARAFAVRRKAARSVAVADPYGESELTSLSKYAKKRPGFPAVTFAASANLTGQNRTPPGRKSVSYTLGSEYIGGPEVGWIRTDFLERLVSQTLRNDLTVESAMAISGAAFASAMGAQTRYFETFLTLTNARLGAWLPNPYFVALKLCNLEDWTIPGLPSLRRISYFAREILGLHSSTERMVLCTDGGHYDNLGLVETLRRTPSVVYCFDASGASPPLADTLAGAMALAREELGVKITLTDPYFLVSGAGNRIQPSAQLAKLNARLSKSTVLVGTITYPEIDGHTPKPGKLVRGHEKVPVFGQLMSPLVATRSPRFWPREVPTPH